MKINGVKGYSMPRARKKENGEIVLIISHKEARYLHGILQNYIGTDQEPIEDNLCRYTLFSTLTDVVHPYEMRHCNNMEADLPF